MSLVNVINMLSNNNTDSSRKGGMLKTYDDDQDFRQELESAMKKKTAQKRRLLSSILNKGRLAVNSGAHDDAFSFTKGFSPANSVDSALDLTKAGLPSSYKKQVGLGLIAMGRDGSSVNSMLAGAGLMNCGSSAEALKGVLNNLGAERSVLKLSPEALPALGQVLADSGLDDQRINELAAELHSGGLTLDQLLYSLSKLDLGSGGGNGGLVATEDGLPALGQFFGSLGASPEIVSAVTNGFTNGEPVTASALRGIIGSADDGFLAPCLTEGDTRSLFDFLSSMGAQERDFKSLTTLLTKTNGQLSMNDFLNFIEGMETAPAKTVTGQELNMVKTILENITRDQALAKTPVFDETLVKLQALGDREIDDDFMKFSPALQALRGGISGMNQNAAFGGQSGQGGQNSHHNQRGDRESKEQYRQILHASSSSEATTAAAIDTVETVQSYGGQESLARQISQKILYSQRRGIHRLKMNLNPENLGELDIELKVKGNQLVAHIRAENREAYAALAGEIEALKDALADSGLEISNLTLSLGDQETGSGEFADLRGLKGFQSDDQEMAPADPAFINLNNDTRQGAFNRVI